MSTHGILTRACDESGFLPGLNWFHVDPFHADTVIPAGVPGVYVICIGGRVAYIGQSNDLRSRLRSHKITALPGVVARTPWGKFRYPHITVRVRASSRTGDWLMRECRLIRRLRSRFNRQVL